MRIYAKQLREGLRDAIDCRKLAEAWSALHPGAMKAMDPMAATFLDRARTAIMAVLQRILPRAWTEGWVLGQKSAQALADLRAVDWGEWKPGNWEAAEKIASDGLRQLLGEQGITIRSIADSRLEELGDLLARYIGSDIGIRPELPEPLPPMFSVQQLADALSGVLDNPSMADMVAQSEIARAQGAAAEDTFLQMGVNEAEISTAADDRVCEVCMAAEEDGPQPVGTYHLGLHPMCRCALIPVLAGAS